MSSLASAGERQVRVDVRAMAPGENATVELDEPIALQSDDQSVDARVSGTLRVDRTNRGVLIRGRVRGQVPLVCSRCLIPFEESIVTAVEEEFSLDPAPAEARGELNADDFVSWVGPGHEVDLTEIVRQTLQMSVPMAPLHAPDCRGLCPVCGTNWNERACEHSASRESETRERGNTRG
jgi:uncharacterized protein